MFICTTTDLRNFDYIKRKIIISLKFLKEVIPGKSILHIIIIIRKLGFS